VGLKNAGFDVDAVLGHSANEFLVQSPAQFRRRGLNEAGPATATSVSVQSELGRGEKRAARVEKRAIHFAFGVAEDPQIDNSFGHRIGGHSGIVAADGEQNHQAGSDFAYDLAIDDYTGAGYALDDGSHGVRLLTNMPCATVSETGQLYSARDANPRISMLVPRGICARTDEQVEAAVETGADWDARRREDDHRVRNMFIAKAIWIQRRTSKGSSAAVAVSGERGHHARRTIMDFAHADCSGA
jgi:hypothetical protein